MRRLIARSLVSALLLLGILQLSSPALAGIKLALVLGNSNYQAAPALGNPANDAADLAQALRGIGFEVIEQRDATREQMASAVRAFAERIRGADVALFFYAGHGLQLNGENYLIPVDAKIESEADVRFDTINLSDIQQEMEGPGRANVVILDACRDNPFADKLSHGGRGIATRGLGRLEAAGVGSLIVFSTQPDNVALDGGGRNSPFTAALLRHVGTPGLEIRQMISKVRGDVLQATGQKQVPWDNSSLVGDVYLAGQSAAGTPAVAGPVAPADAGPVRVAQTQQPAATSPPAAAAASGPAAECERLAAPAPPFASPAQLNAARSQNVDMPHALSACEAAVSADPKNPRLQFLLGRVNDLSKTYLEAARHYTIAADAGYADAQDALGVLVVLGRGVVKNYTRAFDLFHKAALGGSPSGMGNLGSMYSSGFSVKEDDAMALAWYEKSIEAGNSFGLAQAGVMYFNGKGTPRDYDAAAQYFQQEADLGDGYSLKFLAIMYERGLLGKPDPAKAAELRLQAAQVDPESQDPNVPLPRKVVRQTPRPAGGQVVRIRRYHFVGCSWLWC
ncbi:caspase family protein [Labrys wisconsinensis]|uniref:TPR repeat protein n=1 Tax=Labrys wisconsinensis TaxID=425677 RepID=A0ABU0IZC6_9HYPH|nr:caspase family protein [Labrys wisconsinensis]MDQ0467365.1 TPR repeat protein [Labrys wisconsinensis]